MSSPIEVQKNPDGSWTAKGGSSLTVLSVTAVTEHKAVAGHAVAMSAIQNRRAGWISVKDSLPPIRKHVLACRIGKKRNYGPFFAMTCGNELSPWRYIDGDRCDISITHWHELPDLPTE
ncbi:DUF551 domain-containing protein [Pseudomonas sp. 22373]|uniref:DUF551 domain-containing protein n=1 Tax=Pseudomonas sp. 22373 TaxID=3453914 RepID=UPI003F838107